MMLLFDEELLVFLNVDFFLILDVMQNLSLSGIMRTPMVSIMKKVEDGSPQNIPNHRKKVVYLSYSRPLILSILLMNLFFQQSLRGSCPLVWLL